MDTLPLSSPSRALAATTAHVSGIDVDDRTSIERVAAPEGVAFEELYRRFARAVLGLALHIATCPACVAEQASLRRVRSLRGLAR